MLNVTPLRDAEYLISSVALGIDEYYLGVGEAPGVWQGRWAAELGLAGVVEADDLRALVEGRHPSTGVDLVEGNRKRETFAFDATFSCPKSVSLLWAFGSAETAHEPNDTLRDAFREYSGFANAFASGAQPFVTCFCEEDDLLSQWRGYSPGQVGVSIGVSLILPVNFHRRPTCAKSSMKRDSREHRLLKWSIPGWIRRSH